VSATPKPVTPAQHAALRLIASGSYVYDDRTGGAKHHTLTKVARIARRTLLVLNETGLVEYDPLVHGRLVLTDAGRKALPDS
jgi:ribosomal protein S19E (S16A)